MKGRSSDAQRMREVLAPLTSIEPVRTGMEWVAFFSPPFSVRREKAPIISGCETHPATVAPAGSNSER